MVGYMDKDARDISHDTARVGVSYLILSNLKFLMTKYKFAMFMWSAAYKRTAALCLFGSQGGAVHHHTEHPWETNGIKTSRLIRQRPRDEPESLSSCKLIFLLEQRVVCVCVCTVAVALTWLQEPGAVCRERGERVLNRPGNRSVSVISPGFSPVRWHTRFIPCCSPGELPKEKPNWAGFIKQYKMMQLLAAVWEEKERKTPGALIDVILSDRYIIVIYLGQRGQARCQVSWFILCLFSKMFLFVIVSVCRPAKLCWIIS